jgi:hypothetical protein
MHACHTAKINDDTGRETFDHNDHFPKPAFVSAGETCARHTTSYDDDNNGSTE